MSVLGLILMENKSRQLAVGLLNLLGWLVVMPFLAAFILRVVRQMNEAVFGQLAPWQETGLIAGRYFFAAACFGFALYGAAVLSIYILAQAGLIRSPWE